MTLTGGLLNLEVWQLVVITLVLTHITIAGVTVFLHRAQAHRALTLHPLVSHFFRFWLWLTTGMITRQWVAVHRKHHAACETADDPHSPQVLGLKKVLWQGAELYREAANDKALVERFGHGTPDDLVERNLYTRFNFLGVSLLLVVDFILFGVPGIAVWAVQMVWIPFFAAGVINGIGHYFGYRNYQSPDAATNLVPWGILIGGEELHNNHHAFPASARLSSKWWEFDIGWLYIRLLVALRLASVRRIALKPTIVQGKTTIDMDTVRAVVVGRMHVLADYAREVSKPVSRQQLFTTGSRSRKAYRQALRWLGSRVRDLEPAVQQRFAALLEENEILETVYLFRQRLQDIWEKTASSQEQLLQALQEWCVQAEASGIKSLQEFSRVLRSYSLPSDVVQQR